MKIFLYILLGVILIITGFFTWFFMFYLKVPKLPDLSMKSETEKIVSIDNWFQKLEKEKKFNGAVLIINKGKIQLKKTYGFTNFLKKEHLTIHSSFRLASVSKQFTAAGIMLLKEQKAIDFNDLISKYIPDFPYENVTVRHLLNQTSGIPDKYLDLAEKNKEEIGVLTNKKAVKLLIDNKPKINFIPIEKYEYSNTNYIILGYLIEIISKQSFENFMKEELFEPLKMYDTRVWNLISKDKTFPNKTNSFDRFEKKDLKPSFVDGVAGDGGIFSSINDMVIWDKFWYSNELISPNNLRQAFEKPKLKDGKLSNYGFGWIINKDMVWHNGQWLGANTVIMRNIKNKNCLVILDNSSNVFFDKIIEELNTIGNKVYKQ